MIFSSFSFMVFFPVVGGLYYLSPQKVRWLILLLSSYFFYLNLKPVFAVFLIGTTLSTYAAGLFLAKTEQRKTRRLILTLTILVNVGALFFFKYYNFLNGSIYSLLSLAGLRWPLPQLDLLVPIGISFYTFQVVGYITDVYRRDIDAERHLGIFALFVSFFPTILSGPIERAGNMLPQYKSNHPFIYDNAVNGLRLMLWGYFMKLVVADRLGIYVDAVYGNIGNHTGKTLLLATILYTFQLYSDFGGYSLIAIGAAKFMGFTVMENFRRPYLFSRSMSDFWKRNHISLTTWIMDYVYYPLIGTSSKKWIWNIAMLIAFLVSGFWHGVGWNFVIWGFLHGTFVIISSNSQKKRKHFEKRFNLKTNKAWIFLSCVTTYIIVLIPTIFFRASSTQDAFRILQKVLLPFGSLFIDAPTLAYGCFGLLIVFFKDFRDEFFPEKFPVFLNKKVYIRYSAYLILTILILLVGVFDGGQFIYFQF